MAVLRIDTPLRLTIAYAVFGSLWIVLSDALLALGSPDASLRWSTNTVKGLGFIGVTAVFLYAVIHRLVARRCTAEAALRESHQRLALALEAGKQGLYDFNVVSGGVVVNATFAVMLGYDPAEFTLDRASWVDRLHPEDRDRATKTLADYLEGRIEDYRIEFRMKTADGGWRWMLSAGRIIERDPAGRPLRMVGTHTDITDRKISEERTRDALAFAKTVLHFSPLGVIAYGPDGRTVIANEPAAAIVGAQVPELLRQNFRELESWRTSGLLAVAERALRTGEAGIFQGPTSTTFGRNVWLEAHCVPFDYQGGQHLLLIMSDETVTRAALDELHLLHAAVQAAPTGWVITDAAGMIEWVNPAFTRLTGYETSEVYGMKTNLLNSGRQSPEFYRQMWETILAGRPWSGEICNRRKDGTLYDEQMTIAPVRDAEGVIRHFVAMKTDITEHKHLERQLTRTQRLESIGMLASGIAHDLNNVLTPIMLSVELLKTKYPDVDARKYVDTVETAAKRGAGIVRQVLTFARGMDGGERTEVQPRYLLKDVVQLIEETFPRNIEICHEVPRRIRTITGDITQLHQVILNLAVNARDAMPEGGVLTLTARDVRLEAPDPARPALKPGDHVALSVSDTGTGIAPEVLEHMFEPFYTTKPRGKGTGLGLSTVYGIVRSHGGAIDVRSQLGEGTTFEILLPAAPQKTAEPAHAPASARLRGEGRSVLVVDDEESIRSVMAQVLASSGFVPVMAVDGEEGWKAFQAQTGGFAVAVVDMMMPRMNGVELARAIHAVAPAMPIIVSTGLMNEGSNPGLEIGWEAFGVRAVLRKPYTEEKFLEALGRAMEPSTDAAAAS